MAFVAKCYQILVNAVNVLLVINAIYLSNSISKLVSSVPAIKPEYRSVCKQAHISNFQMQQLFYSHLFCKGCLIYCSGFATTWLSVGWSSVSAAFCRERERDAQPHVTYHLCVQNAKDLILNIYTGWIPICPLIAITQEVCTAMRQETYLYFTILWYETESGHSCDTKQFKWGQPLTLKPSLQERENLVTGVQQFKMHCS